MVKTVRKFLYKILVDILVLTNQNGELIQRTLPAREIQVVVELLDKEDQEEALLKEKEKK